MNESCRTPAKKPSSAQVAYRVLLAVVIGLAMLAVFSVQDGWADSGGWPTPTYTPIPLPTITPTYALLPYLPSPTATLMELLPPVTQAPALLVATPTPQRRNTALLCWPFAIAFILIVIIASIMLIQRRNYS